jgi:hypothetical protein
VPDSAARWLRARAALGKPLVHGRGDAAEVVCRPRGAGRGDGGEDRAGDCKLNVERASVIAVTNMAESPLAEPADAAVMTRAGEESAVSCKTYVATRTA